MKTTKKTRKFSANLVNIMTLVNIRSALSFRPRDAELKSVFLVPEIRNLYTARISFLRIRNHVANFYLQLYKKQRGLCPYCSQFLGYLDMQKLEIHHIIPISKNPKLTSSISNMQLLHISCHRAISINESK